MGLREKLKTEQKKVGVKIRFDIELRDDCHEYEKNIKFRQQKRTQATKLQQKAQTTQTFWTWQVDIIVGYSHHHEVLIWLQVGDVDEKANEGAEYDEQSNAPTSLLISFGIFSTQIETWNGASDAPSIVLRQWW